MPHGHLGFAAPVLAAGLLAAFAAPAQAETVADAPAVSGYEATVRVMPDGALEVSESFDYQAGAQAEPDLVRTIATRVPYDTDRDQVYSVDQFVATVDDQEAEAQLTDGDDGVVHLEVTPDEQFATGEQYAVSMDYLVRGAVRDTVDGLELQWPVVQGFDGPVDDIDVGLVAPDVTWAACFAGQAGSSMPCTATQLTERAHPDFFQDTLPAGERMTIVAGFPDAAGIVPDQQLDQRWSFARAFSLTPLSVAMLVVLVLLAAGAAAALWWWRSAGERASRGGVASNDPGELARQLVTVENGETRFEPPDGVRAGEMGTVLNERADVVDVAASIIDLAVRGYLVIEELPHSSTYARTEWRLRPTDATFNDGGLLQSERAILAAIFDTDPDGSGPDAHDPGDPATDSASDSAADPSDGVLLTDLAHTFPGRLGFVQDRLYADVVVQRWFAIRPDAVRGRWSTAGVVLAVAGMVLTLVLAAVTELGLVGLGVVLAGAILTWSGQVIPSRTGRGAQLLSRLRVFRDYVESADLSEFPEHSRPAIAERILPYAVVFGFEEHWVRVLADTDEDDTPDAGFSWYRAPADWHLREDLPESMHNFVTTLIGAISVSRRLRI